MRGPQRAVQGGGREPVPERKHEQEPEDEREGERERSEAQCRTSIPCEVVQVELEPCDEHEIEEPECPEGLDDAFPGDPVEHERSDEGPAENDPDEAG